MRTVLAVLMFTAMIQVANADDANPSSDTASACVTSTDGTVTCL
jgi:hypothetical protein